jgi:hypothetical protein
MNTRHPYQQSESHHTMDSILDILLTGADQDLHASLKSVLNVDAGLDAILGHSATLPRKTQPPRIAPKLARLSSSVKNYANRALSAVIPFLGSQIRITKLDFETTAIDPGANSVDEQIAAIIKLVNLAYGSKRRRKIRDLDYGHQALRELQEGFAGRRLSRIEADELIGSVETKLRRTLRNSFAWWRLVPLMIILTISTSLLFNCETAAYMIAVLIGSTIALFFRKCSSGRGRVSALAQKDRYAGAYETAGIPTRGKSPLRRHPRLD